MASIVARELWLFTPLQAIGIVANAANTGTSGLQTYLAMPMFRLEKVPPHVAGTQLLWLLHQSEILFPPINAIGTLTNLVVGVTGYLYRDSNAAAKAKYPYALAAFALNVAVTAYALGIMAPINRKIKARAKALEVNQSDEKSGKELRELVAYWQPRNLGRGALMLAATVVGLFGLVEDGSVAKLARF